MPVHPRPLRADAQRNRDAIVAAAREVMGRRGLDAPLDEIAQAAGVGNATLYRRFPSRRELVQAVFADGMSRYASAGERALQVDDPWAAVCGYLTDICALQAEHRALADLVTSTEYVDDNRALAVASLQRLLDRARAAGVLRRDLTLEDVALMLTANAGVVRQAGDRAVEASRRFVALLLDGLHAAPH
ncbi:TetR/AcrR family transcriptional regulator [Geodermatophilus sabuli]|uniref:Transcriptional regulator, TetR family n=1 Tax=Geodermatophilus sabuli TaxID=1564158 RepID=A0A285E6R7_9ACTN|nr:TetR/AcrR family transcriptional regulator [Geodermatophilus sabuli]MBB3082415.1 AcrR family transcriptional regulator [Geodermatophilus sabuli]SNX94715.1 transcriptional regulator, TetR family [Geodermatophilus sabuli]